jgi:hypothetical protein
MFDKWRKAVEANEQYQKAKAHVQRNQNTYLVGAAGIAGIAGVLVFKSRPVITIENVASPVFNNSVAPVIAPVIENVVNNGGHMTKIVKCLETGQIWEKMSYAALDLAKSHGITPERAQWLISRNTNGAIPDVFGMHFENLGLATTG